MKLFISCVPYFGAEGVESSDGAVDVSIADVEFEDFGGWVDGCRC